MTRPVRCPNCRSVLNVPERGIHYRLRCPRCTTRFYFTQHGPRTEAELESSRQTPPESFAPIPGPSRTTPPSLSEIPVSKTPRPLADPASLLDQKPPPRSRSTHGDARQKARRCRSCGGLVQRGMSICSTCGLDQETGLLDHTPIPVAPEPAPEIDPMPLGVGVLGTTIACTALFFGTCAVIDPIQTPLIHRVIVFAASVYTIYASVTFLLGRSLKPIALSLVIAALLAIALLIVVPTLSDGPAHQLERVGWPRLISASVGLVALALAGSYLATSQVKHFLDQRQHPLVDIDDSSAGFPSTI